eukprot:s1053_g9.t2
MRVKRHGTGADPESKRRRISTKSRTEGIVMDIGANFGQSSERYLDAGFQVVAVEPNPAAAKAIRERLGTFISSGELVLEETAIWSNSSAKLYINKEDSEWSSCFQTVGSRYDTEAEVVDVKSTDLAALFEKHGTPWYLKLDTEGADGLILDQARPGCQMFASEQSDYAMQENIKFENELNSLVYLKQAAEQGYLDFKVVPQGHHKAKHLLDEHGRMPLECQGSLGLAKGKRWSYAAVYVLSMMSMQMYRALLLDRQGMLTVTLPLFELAFQNVDSIQPLKNPESCSQIHKLKQVGKQAIRFNAAIFLYFPSASSC